MVQPHTVLVVDDSEVIRVMFAELLQLWGYRALTASDPTQALHLAGTEPVDAVFTDLQLGGKTGLELCRELQGVAQQRGRALPVWLMSGSDERDYSVEAAEAGASGFLRKPFKPSEVVRKLGERLVPPNAETLKS